MFLLAAVLLQSAFSDAVAKNFDAWDKDGDGALSAKEIDGLIDDASIKGEPAAALGTIKSFQRSKKVELPPLTRDYFKAYTKGAKDYPDFETRFAAGVKKIAKAKREVFEPGAPSLEAFHQGRLGDCFFLAPVGAAIARDADAVRAMIAAREDGAFDVALPGKTVRVDPLTDAELVLTSSTENEGVWLAVLEKAAGTVRNEALPEEKKRDSETDLIASGGSPGPMIRLLTGKASKGLAIRPKGKKEETPDDAKVDELLPKLREAVQSAVKDRRLICATTPQSKGPPGIAGKHAYAILGFDEKEDRVDLWNPWGNTFKPKGAAGLENGYPTKDGRFAMPLRDFAKVYGSISYEAP